MPKPLPAAIEPKKGKPAEGSDAVTTH